jgi:hypothetical protein
MSAPLQEIVWMNPDACDAPTVAVERRWPDEGWVQTYNRILSRLRAGVAVVVIPDEATRTAYVYSKDFGHQRFGPDDELMLPGFAVRVADLFT